MGCPSEVVIEKNLTFSIRTHDPDTGALTAAGAVPTYRIYKDGNETAILSGDMDDGSGTNNAFDEENLDAAYQKTIACTVANGFAVHKTYTVYMDATVDSDAGGISHAFRVVGVDVPAVFEEV